MLFNFFKKNKKTMVPELESASENNSIIFLLDSKTNNQPYVKMNIIDTSDEQCSRYAEMLFNINAGMYHQSILDLMVNMGQTDATIKKFIHNVLLIWAKKMKDSDTYTTANSQFPKWNNNKPQVLPTDFNKYVSK